MTVADDARAGRCWYCGSAALKAGDPPEHIIPDAMGGTLKTDRVCRECNSRAGREIDAPFMRDWLIAMDRALHAPGGHRMRPRIEATLDDGTPVDLETRKGPWKATVRGAIEWEDDAVTIRASNRAEYDKLVARARRDAEAQGRTFLEHREPTESETSGPVRVTSNIDGVAWLRMAAKITLACLSKVLDDAWLDSAEAAKYRGWLWEIKPVTESGSPAHCFPTSANEMDPYVLDPPEHLLYFAPARKGRVVLTIAYYGRTIVRAGVDVYDFAMPRVAWRTGPGAPPDETTFDALVMEAVVKQAEAADDEAEPSF